MAADKQDVSTPSAKWTEMSEDWTLLHDLLGGTNAMRKAEELWLPREEKETALAYQGRLKRSFLYGAYEDTVDKITAKLFTKPIVLEGADELPEQLQPIEKNVDRAGTSLTDFFKANFRSGVIYGYTHVLVDYPQMDTAVTLADERAVDARPYFVEVKPCDLFAWNYERLPNGELQLTQVRIRQCVTVKDGEWGEKEVERVKVFGKNDWQVWELQTTTIDGQKTSSWVKTLEGNHTLGEVPIKTLYLNRTGFMTADPPLYRLAEQNLAHWQSYSDHRNILRFSRVGLLFAAGFSDEEIDKGIYVGPNQMIATKNPAAHLEHVEHSGASIKAGTDDLEDLEERMEVLGLQPLIARSAGSTATGKMLDENRTATDAQAWARSLEQFIVDCYKMAAKWVNVELEDDAIKVNIVDTFNLLQSKDTDITNLIALANAIPPKISATTLLEELKRRGLLQENLDVEKELAAIETQGPDLGSLGDVPGQPQGAMTLNGAQISAATAIITAVALGEMPRDTGIGQLKVLFNLTPEQAEEMMGSAGTGKKITANPVVGKPAAKPPTVPVVKPNGG